MIIIDLNREMLSNGSICCTYWNGEVSIVINKLIFIIHCTASCYNITTEFDNNLYFIYGDGSISSTSRHNIYRIYNTGDIVDSFIVWKELLLTDYYSMQYTNIYRNINWTYKNNN